MSARRTSLMLPGFLRQGRLPRDRIDRETAESGRIETTIARLQKRD